MVCVASGEGVYDVQPRMRGDGAQRTSTEQEDVAAIYGCDTDKVDLGPTTKVDKSRYLL